MYGTRETEEGSMGAIPAAQQVVLHACASPSRLPASRPRCSGLHRRGVRRCCCVSLGAAVDKVVCCLAFAFGWAADVWGVREVLVNVREIELEEGGRVVGQGTGSDNGEVAYDV